MKMLLYFLLGFFLLSILVFTIGPRPDTNDEIVFDVASIGSDPDAYLAKSESTIVNITPGAEKEIIWADPAARTKTTIAVIYIHGFSATKMEIRPVPDNVAKALGANLFYTRLTGNGRDGVAMAEVKLQDWANDFVEAIKIGERIGEKLIVLSTSTGSTLSVWGAAHPELMRNVDGMVMVSANFALQGISIGALNMPWSKTILPLIAGKQRSWEPVNEQHGKWWTTSYPSSAVFPLGALMKKVEAIDKSSLKLPVLFIFSNNDTVIVPDAIRRVANAWGGPVEQMEIANPDDPSKHVITGDILSPNTTDAVSTRVIEWVNAL